MAKTTRSKKENTMSSNDALAALGLDMDDASVSAPAVVQELAVTETASAAQEDTVAETAATDKADPREEVELGELELGTLDHLPALTRLGNRGGSKFKFDELAAPEVGADGKTKYSFFAANAQEGVDSTKIKRSVQSATTQANKRARDEGSNKYFVTRTENKEGKFHRILVIRTDARPEVEENEGE